MPLAYSYLRFSDPKQEKGDSIRRQTQNREDWLAAHPGVALDKSLYAGGEMADRGRSAYRRKNWDTYALAQFCKHIKSGRVEPGSYLLVENLDRLSRENAGEALQLFLEIVNAGIIIVQLTPVVMEFARPVESFALMYAIMELSRGHSESAVKSDRVGRYWRNRLGEIGKGSEAGRHLTNWRLPAWFKRGPAREDGKPGRAVLVGGRPVPDPVRVAAVRRIFAQTIAGDGAHAIARTLRGEGVPVIGRQEFKGKPVLWTAQNVYAILTNRATIGEYTPHRATARTLPGVRPGDPVPDFYPPVIDPDTYHAAQAAIATRSRVGRGRRGLHVNLFTGLLLDARDGRTMSYSHMRERASLIIPTDAKNSLGGKFCSFPSGPFESALTARIAEVSAADVSEDPDDAVRKVESLSGQLSDAEEKLKWYLEQCDREGATREQMDVFGAKAIEWEKRRHDLAERYSDAKREASSPLGVSLGEFRSLSALLSRDNSDEMRVRVRAALRRTVDCMYCLFEGRGVKRLALVQVWFRGGGRREFVVLHRNAFRGGRGAGRATTPADTVGTTFARPDMPDGFDLSRAGHVAWAEGVLGGMLDERAADQPPAAGRGSPRPGANLDTPG